MTPRRAVRPLLVGAGVLALVWLVSGVLSPVVAHQQAEARWEAKEPAAYSFEYHYCSGMCASCDIRVTVENGTITNAVWKGPCSEQDIDRAPTVENVFDMAAGDRFAPDFEVRYDPVWGFPASVSTRCGGQSIDCGTGYGVSDFRVVSRSAATAGPP